MASLIQFKQQYVDLADGKFLGIHVVELKSASDTITLPNLDNTTSGAAIKQLRKNGQSALTVTSSGNTVTIAGGSAGDEVVLTSLHQSKRNYIPEA